jgi:hypothetical protein
MVVVVGGHSRNIGKTSVVCGIIRGIPDFAWTAVKVTQFGHQVCSRDGEPCECADPKHPIAVSEENGLAPTTDSGRFLSGGAKRAYWVRTPAGRLAEALPRLRRIMADSEHVIVESNSLMQFVKPDAYLMVLDGAIPDFKASSLRALDRAHAIVATSEAPLAWENVPHAMISSRPRFFAPPPLYEAGDLIAFLHGRSRC